MTQEERELIKKEIMQEMEQRFSLRIVKDNIQSVLAEPRNKWFRKGDSLFESIMYKINIGWESWESIRKLTCLICGVGHVSRLPNKKIAGEIAERLCQTVYDLRKKYLEAQNDKR